VALFIPSRAEVCSHFARWISIFFISILLALNFCLAARTQERPSEKPPKPAEPSAISAQPQAKASISPSGPIRISWVGDIVMEVPWRQQMLPPNALFDGVRDRLKTADLTIANLETPLTDWAEQTPYKDKSAVEAGKDVILRVSSPQAAQALAQGGIKVVGLANNHTMDFTDHGLLETLDRLRKAGVLFAGAGENLAAAEDALVVQVKGRRVGILSFSDVVPRYSWAEENHPGIATGKEADRVVEAIRRARPKVDILILLLHWGTQFVSEPVPRQLFLAQQAQRAGADLVLGAHPHVLQGVGCLGRVPVVYSAGNFVFPTMSLPTRRSAIFEFEFSVSGPPALHLVPVMIDEQGAPQLAEGDIRQDILLEMSKLSQPLGLQLNGDTGSCRDVSVPPIPPVVPIGPSGETNRFSR
jgi:poly-gamma-glutamate capsule biosynthesis protein CapA/YwtB (metallophosphatase superfamily)